jgi:hypothetical protein
MTISTHGGAAAPARPIGLRRSVAVIAALGALSSGGALVATILLDRPLWLASVFVFVPGFITLVALSVMLRRDEQTLFLTRLRAGVIAGIGATAAYDIVRWVIERLDLVRPRSFVAIRVFGAGLTGRDATSDAALVAGWVFHAVNGIGFALAYIFVAAGRRFSYAIVYALALEAFMVSLYPGWLGFTLNGEFLSVSVAGHLAYGTVLGLIARRSE